MIPVSKDLSSKLTGDDNLSLSLAEEYYACFLPDATFIKLLERYREIVNQNPADLISEIEEKLLTAPDFRMLIKKIIMLWYLGSSDVVTGDLKGDKHYFHYEALVWKVIHAHPPGLTGGYYGYWAYKPEN
jgi:hypothetical protein